MSFDDQNRQSSCGAGVSPAILGSRDGCTTRPQGEINAGDITEFACQNSLEGTIVDVG
jgi:hypothetical protein